MADGAKDFVHDFVEDEIGDSCIICGKGRADHLTQTAQLSKFRSQAQDLQEEIEQRNTQLEAITRERDGLRVELRTEKLEKEKYFRRLLKIEKEYNSLVEFANQQQKNIKEMQITMKDVTERKHSLGRHAHVWGHNKLGQLSRKNRMDVVVDPVECRQLQDIGKMKGFVHIACGKAFTCAVTLDGDLYAWGDNREGQLGNGKRGYSTHVPQLVKGDLDGHHVTLVECGEYHTAAVTDKGRLFTWGYGLDGQLGHGEKQRLELPREVQAIKNTEFVVSVACGASHTMAVVVADDNPNNTIVMGWGRNKEGQAGLKGLSEQTVPARLETLKEFRVSHVAAGEDHTMSIDGHVLTSNEEKQDTVEKGELNALTRKIANQMDPTKAAEAEIYGGESSGILEEQDEDKKKAAEKKKELTKDIEIGGGNDEDVDFRAQRALKLQNQQLIQELENHDAIFSAEYRETKRTVNRFFHLWLRMRETSIERLNPNVTAQMEATKNAKMPTSLDKLIVLSNEAVDAVAAEARDLAMQGKGDMEIRYQLADLLADNAALRKSVNDFTEGILIHTSDNLRKFHQNFEAERKRQAQSIAARDKLNVFGKDKKDKVVKDSLGRETKQMKFGFELDKEEDIYEDPNKPEEKEDELPPWRKVVTGLVKGDKDSKPVAKQKLSRSKERMKDRMSRSRSRSAGSKSGSASEGAASSGDERARSRSLRMKIKGQYARADAKDNIATAAANVKASMRKTKEKVGDTRRALREGAASLDEKRREKKREQAKKEGVEYDEDEGGVLASLISAFTGGSTSARKKPARAAEAADDED